MTKKEGKSMKSTFYWGLLGAVLLGFMVSYVFFSEIPWVFGILAAVAIGAIVGLVIENRKKFKTRSAAVGIYSGTLTLILIGFVTVINYLGYQFPKNLDLTENKVYSLSDQTVKVLKNLNQEVTATIFDNFEGQSKHKPLLENYRGISNQFKFEFVDPNKEQTRAKQAGIKKLGTLVLSTVGAVGDVSRKVDPINEENLTNALIKILSKKQKIFCAISGHGEKDFDQRDANGLAEMRSALEAQSYLVKKISLQQNKGSVPSECLAIGIFGPEKAFFASELKGIEEYLKQGGRAFIAFDYGLDGKETAKELKDIVSHWYVNVVKAVIVDPASRYMNMDAFVSMVPSYSTDHSITKDFKINSVFPLARPLEIIAGAPASLNIQWLAKTMPTSWGETSSQEIKTGRVEMTQGQDKQGPLEVMISVEGKLKDSTAKQNTRLIIAGTSLFANNQFSRFGGNGDLFVNTISWLLEDESLISIRKNSHEKAEIALSSQTQKLIFLLSVILFPLLISIAGVVVWVRRRRL